MYYAYQGAEPPPRAGASHATIYPYGPFPAGDGQAVMLGLQNEREWYSFCEVVMKNAALASDERFNTNSRRSTNRDELRALIIQAFSHLSADKVIARLEDASIANAHVNDMQGVWQHPQLEARQRWVGVHSPSGNLPALLPPGRSSAFQPKMNPVPELGEHNSEILAQLGYGLESIASFKTSGVI